MKSFAYHFQKHAQELRPIRRYELTCQCEACSQTLYQYKQSIIIEGFDLTLPTVQKLLEKNEGEKYPMKYIKGKFIHTTCYEDKFEPKEIVSESLARLAFYRLANDDHDFFDEIKQFMREVKNNNNYIESDPQIDGVTADQLIEALHTMYKPYGGKQ